jgi:RNase adapter protein RapZ
LRLIIISGLSGSGKSVALHVLEDLGFYCIDNIPVPLLKSFVAEIVPRQDPAFENVGIGLDARSRPSDLAEVPTLVQKLRADGLVCEIIFLQTDTKTLLSRFSETRRKHPLTDEKTSLEEAIAKERELLGPIINSAELVIDTTGMSVYALREQIRGRVAPRAPGSVSILIESFGYKHGLPANADFVFDVRCLPNPYWEPQLRALNGKDDAVKAFLDAAPMVQRMVEHIVAFLEEWIPRYQDFQRSYLTVAIGCTGGMHRSVYVAEAVARQLAQKHANIRTHHNEVR